MSTYGHPFPGTYRDWEARIAAISAATDARHATPARPVKTLAELDAERQALIDELRGYYLLEHREALARISYSYVLGLCGCGCAVGTFSLRRAYIAAQRRVFGDIAANNTTMMFSEGGVSA